MIGWLNENDSKSVNYINGDVKRTVGKLKCPEGDGYISMEVFHVKSKIDVVNRGGMPAFTVKVRIEQNISDVECDTDMTKKSFVEYIAKFAQERTESLFEHAIHRSQRELRSDYIGFCEIVHRKLPKLWHTIKDDWTELYPDVPIDLRIEIFVRRAGTTSQSVEYELTR